MTPFEITMDGPGKNSLGTTMMTFLLAKIAEANGRPILLTGAGDAFSAGLDLMEVAAADAAAMGKFLDTLESLMAALFAYPGPTAAVVNGHAIAGGCILTLCCDHRVALRSPKTRIGLNEVALGLRFPPRVLGIVRHRVPPGELERVILGAGLHDPDAALRLGLIDEVSDEPRAAAEKRLAVLASHPAPAYAAAKHDLRAHRVAVDPADDARFKREALPSWTSPELKAKIRAVLGK